MHHEYVVVALAAHGGVFVLAEPPEVERLTVDEEARAVDLDCADADRQRVGVPRNVAIAPQQDGQIAEVTFARPPRADVRHGEPPLAAGGPGGLGAVGVGQHEAPLEAFGARGLHLVVDRPGGPGEARDDGDVADVRRRGGVEPDRPVQAGVVEEVVEVVLARAIGGLLDVARRDRLPGQDVVDHSGDAVLGARLHDRGDVGLERRVAALVLGDLAAIDPHHRAMGGRAEAQDDPLAGPAGRDPGQGLVPHVADVVAGLRVGEDVVVAGGHRHLTRPGRQAVLPALIAARPGGVEREPPQAVKGLAFPGRRVLGSEHAYPRGAGTGPGAGRGPGWRSR